MEQVTGIGGLFFRARDPEGPGGLVSAIISASTPVPTELRAMQPWRQEAGPTAFAPFPATIPDYLGDRSKSLDDQFPGPRPGRDGGATARRRRCGGPPVPQAYPNGRFAQLQ